MAVRYIGTSISGIASDTKPTPTANEMGVLFVETDTNKLYQWDTDSWNEVNPPTVLVTDNESTSENNLIPFVANAATATGQQSIEMDGDFHYNPGSGTVTATTFSGATSGAVTATSIALNGNITTAAARVWTLMDNNASALSFDAAGKTGILVFDSRNGAERVTMSGDLLVSGDLTVSGTETTVSSTTINVADPLVALATTNTTNAVDIGFYGRYRTNGTNLYTGLVWDAGASKYILFHGNQVAPTTTVNTSGTGHTTSTLIANLEGNVTGNTSGTAATVTGAAQTAITSVGTLTTLTVDNITVNGNTISTGANDLTINTAGGSVYIQDHLKPQADDTYDLGSTGYAWRNLHLEGDITMQDAGKIATSAGDLAIEPAGNNVVVKGTGTAASFLDVDSVSGQNSRLRFLNGTTAKWNLGNDAGASDNFTIYNQAASVNSISVTAANVLTLGGNTSVSGTITSTGQIKSSGITGSGVWIDRTNSANSYLRISNTTDANGYLGYEGTNMVFNTENSTRMTLNDTNLTLGDGLSVDGYNDANTRDNARFKSQRTTGNATYLRIGRYGSGDDGMMMIGNNYDRAGGSFGADNTSVGVSAIQFETNGSLDFQTAAAGSAQPTSKMVIEHTGDVGIGIADPASRLDIFKEIAGTTSTLTGQNYNAINVYANNYGNTITSSTNYGLLVRNRWAGYNAAGTFTSSQGIAAKFIVDSSWGVLPNAFGVVVQPRASNHQTITSYYGLYVEAPDLHDGNGIITNRFGVYVADATYKNYFAGTVGIGETSPASMLHIKHATTSGLEIETTGADSNAIMTFDNDARWMKVGLFGDDSDKFKIVDSAGGATDLFEVDASGSVFIPDGTLYVDSGTTNTVAKFESSDAEAVFHILDSNSATDYPPGFEVNGNVLNVRGGTSAAWDGGATFIANGNVGIGSHATTPAVALEVDHGANTNSFIRVQYSDSYYLEIGPQTIRMERASGSSGDLTISTTSGGSGAAGNYASGGGDIVLDTVNDVIIDSSNYSMLRGKDDGTEKWNLYNDSSGNITLKNVTQDRGIAFRVNDGGSNVDALYIYGSTSDVSLVNTKMLRWGGESGTTRIYGDSSADLMTFVTNGNEALRIASSGQVGIAGANYGTDGQVLTSKGNSASPEWADASGGGVGQAIAMAIVFGG